MKNQLIIWLLFVSIKLNSQTIYVNPQATGANNGTSWANAYTDLQVAINNAPSGSSLWLRSATYYPIRDTTGSSNSDMRNNMFYILRKSLNIYGGFNGTETNFVLRDPENNPTYISGENSLTPNDSTDNIRLLLYVDLGNNKTVFIEGVRFKNAFNPDGNSFISNSNYQGAVTYKGGLNSKLQFDKCKFFNNIAKLSGGAICASGTIHLYKCEFGNNYAAENGGAVYAASGMDSSIFINCYFHHNKVDVSSGYGGAVKASNQSLSSHQFHNCIFFKNEARYGGAVQLSNIDANFHNCTFYENFVPPSTPGFITGGASIYTNQVGKVKVFNSILFTSGRAAIRDFSGTEVVKVYNSIVFGGYSNGTNIFNYVPYFIDAVNGNFAPAYCSPIIDAGVKDSLPASLLYDWRYNNRVYNNQVDLGAIELQDINKSFMVDSTNPAFKRIYFITNLEGASLRWLRCNNNYEEIPNANSNSLLVTESGTYTVEIAQGYQPTTGAKCVDTLDCVSIQYANVGVQNISLNEVKCIIYPNPATNVLNIESTEEIQSVKVVDVAGRIVNAQQNLSIFQKQLSLVELEVATYFVIVQTVDGKTYIKRFIKQ